MLKHLRECSYTFETGEGRTAQLYLNYNAPTCPTIQGGKKWWNSLGTQVQIGIVPWFSPQMRKLPRGHQNALQSPDTHMTNNRGHLMVVMCTSKQHG